MSQKKLVMGEFQLADPSFRTASRIVANRNEDGSVEFALEYQHDGEPGVWLPEEQFPWHQKNFDAIICSAFAFREMIGKVIRYREKKAKE